MMLKTTEDNLSSVIRTVVTKIYTNRMSEWYEQQLDDKQNGFRQNYSTATGVLPNKLVHNIVNKKKQMAFLLFVDLTAAFDKLNRDFLWKTIKLRFRPGTGRKIINLLEHLYSSTSAEIKGNESLVFNTETGVFLVGPESPILYNLFMDYFMRIFMLKCTEENVSFISHSYSIPEYARSTGAEVIGETDISWSGYADDISMHLGSIKDLQTASRILDQVFGQYQLIINYRKTETMILNYLNADTPTNLTEHIKTTHENESHLQRVNCKMRSRETSNLKDHNKVVHENKDEHHCDSCEKTYKHRSSLRRHIEKVHENKSEHHCDSCDKT